MTKIEELEQRLEVMEQVSKAYGIFKEEVEQLRKALAELKESKKEGKWKPKNTEEYWFMDTDGNLMFSEFDSENRSDKWRVKNLPIFRTHGEAYRYWHFMDTVKEKSCEFTADEWKNDEIKKYTIYYNFLRGEFATTYISDSKFLGEIYFKEKSDAQYIIDNFKDELMEYWI